MNNNQPLITVTYTLADGKTVEINVPLSVAQVLEESDKLFQSQGRTDRRYLRRKGFTEGVTEAVTLEQEDLADMVDKLDEYTRLHKALESLSAVQKRRVRQYFFSGLNYSEIARREGVAEATIRECIKAALKKIKNNF